MRLSRLLPCLALAACGDNKATNPDGNHPPIDAPQHDTAIDMPVDMGTTGSGSRVWAVGDLLTDTQLIGTSFVDGDTLPFGPSNPPPVIVPAGGHVMQPKNANQVIDSNGHKIAFIADATTAGQFDLLVADADGSNPVTLVQGTGFTIQSVALSPDGTKVAYTADSAAIVGGFDLYVVDTTGTGIPVRVSPDRGVTATTPANNDVLSFTWSADSKFLGFTGDLNVDGAKQPYAVDTTAATPTAVELISVTDVGTGGGVSGAVSFDAQNRLFFSARLGLPTAQFQLVKVDSDGQNKQINPAFVPMRSDNSAPDIGAVAISPDGTMVVFGADAPTATAYNVYAVALSTGTPVQLTNLTPVAGITLHTSFTQPLSFSPDGKTVAAVANFKATGTTNSSRQEPFVMKVDGSDTHRLVDVIDNCSGACDAGTLQWTKDSATLYLLGDVTLNNDTKVYRVDPAMTDQTPTTAIDVTTGVGDFIQLVVR